MLIKRRRGWEVPESEATPEDVYVNRRQIMLATGVAVGASVLPWHLAAAAADHTSDLYPAPRNERYVVERELTDEDVASTYNNFYEFGSHKHIQRQARRLETQPWTISIDGLVEQPFEIEFEDLVRRMPLEERLYRLRCVEAWAMTVPWTGFPLKDLVALARPLGSAKYLRMETFLDPGMAPGQRQSWYPWPYVEGLTMAEATNELAFLVTGVYGKPVANQFGAPIRLAVPWKYGFKSVKSIVRFQFTEERPVTFWEDIQPAEYGFWANVNPEVPHPRWSQAEEELIGTDGTKVPTRIYNGYGDFVAGLYRGMSGRELYM